MWVNPRGPRYRASAILLALAACGGQPQSSPAAGSQPRPSGDSVEVGYGTQPKDKVMGAVTALTDRDVTTRPLQIEQLLRGRVAGLQVIQRGNAVTFRIRSSGTALLDQEPLFVLDGVQIPEGALNTALAGLTPDDIKAVSVLKDVASTSIYGGRGAGGVVVITTKQR